MNFTKKYTCQLSGFFINCFVAENPFSQLILLLYFLRYTDIDTVDYFLITKVIRPYFELSRFILPVDVTFKALHNHRVWSGRTGVYILNTNMFVPNTGVCEMSPTQGPKLGIKNWLNKPDVVGSITVTTEFFLISFDSNQVPKWFGTHYNLEVPL